MYFRHVGKKPCITRFHGITFILTVLTTKILKIVICTYIECIKYTYALCFIIILEMFQIQ